MVFRATAVLAFVVFQWCLPRLVVLVAVASVAIVELGGVAAIFVGAVVFVIAAPYCALTGLRSVLSPLLSP